MQTFKHGILFLLLAAIGAFLAHAATASTSHVMQSERKIPVISSVDIVIVGGTSAGVAAAGSAARSGAKVFLVAPRPYLGEDMCATLRFEGSSTTPGQVKAALAAKLLDAGVDFRYASYVTDVLRGRDRKPCGVVIANRGGRQAVLTRFQDLDRYPGLAPKGQRSGRQKNHKPRLECPPESRAMV